MLCPAAPRAFMLASRLLRGLAPDGVKLYRHQAVAVALGLAQYERHGGYGLVHDLGTGKTLTMLSILGIMHSQRQATTLLVVCPKSVFSAWMKDAPHLAGVDLLLLSKGGAANEAAVQRKLLERDASGARSPLIVVVNYEMVWRIEPAMRLLRPDIIAADESQKIKSRTTKQSKLLHKLGPLSRFNVIMSGTPALESGLDWFSQFQFCDPSLFGSKFINFANRYGRQVNVTREQKKWVVNPAMKSELEAAVMSRCHVVMKEDCLDLPGERDEVIVVPLSRAERTAYDQLAADSLAELEDEFGSLGEVVADHVLTKILRLQQLAGGNAVIDNPAGDDTLMRVGSSKLDRAMELIELAIENGEKVVVFHRYREEGRQLEEELARRKIETCVVNGSVPGDERIQHVKAFQEGTPQVFVAQIAAASSGITLTASCTSIFYSTSFSAADFLQARGRTYRMGQRSPVTHYHLIAEDTVDEDILAALQQKRSVADDMVNGGWRRWLGGSH